MFKKSLAGILMAAALSSAIAAPSWTMITESDDGDRLVVDVSSFTIDKDEKDKRSPYYIMATFKMESVYNGKPFTMVIEADSCDNKGGDLWVRIKENNKWKTVSKFFWTSEAGKMYDGGGDVLCIMLAAELKKFEGSNEPLPVNPTPPTNKKSKQMI